MSALTPLKVVRPLPITDAILISSTAPETDYAAWNGATAYVVGDRVIRTTTHKIYQRVAAGTTATAPESDPVNWLAVSPTNRWKMFDTSNTTKTVLGATLSVVLRPAAIVRGVGLLGLVGASVRLRVSDPVEGFVYDRLTPLTGVIPESTWWHYFFAPNAPVTSQVLTDLPPYPGADILLDIQPLSGVSSIATMVIGDTFNIGLGIESGARVGITDYSRKETNVFGDVILVQRAYSKRASFEVHLTRAEEDAVFEFLTELRSVPALWIGAESRALTFLFGFYKDFEIVLSYAHRSIAVLDLEGLS